MNDFATVKRLHETVIQINTRIYTADYAGGYYLRGLKSALALMGICSDFMAEPSTRLDAEGRERVERALSEPGFLSSRAENIARSSWQG